MFLSKYPSVIVSSTEKAQQVYLVQTKAQGCKQAQEADTGHPQITKAVLHQHAISLESGLEGN